MQLYQKVWIIILLDLACVLPCNSQTGCINSYNQNNLPKECSATDQSCSFQSFTNSSLIVVNSSSTNQTFIVCLNLPGYQVNFQSGSDNLEFAVYVNAMTISLSSYAMVTTNDAIFISSSNINLSSSNLTGHLIWMQSGTVSLTNSSIKVEELFETDCNCLDKGASCEINSYFFPFLYSSLAQPSPFNMSLLNYTYSNWNFFGQNVNSIMISANDSINIDNSTLRVSVIAIYSPSITLNNSQINTTGLGFPSGTGYGCGYFNQVLNQLLGCSGTGGSYGGYGGNSSPEGCNLLFSNPPYSRELIPKYPGSGGGFFLRDVTEVSSGGGVINIQTQTLTIQSSQIVANGVGGIQGGAGGAGGSISIDYLQLNSNGVSKMSANGGTGKSSGSGGRVRIWDQNWKTYQPSSQQNMVIEVKGGLPCESRLTCGEDGSIISSPCPPGYSNDFTTFTCQTCKNGTYQLSYGYSKCTPCKSSPSHSYYPGETNSNFFSNYTQVCAFNCNSGYSSYNNQECLTNFELLLANVGGVNLLICIGIIVASLIIFLIITMIRKLSYSDSNSNDASEHIDYYKKKSYFKIEDIPFHQIRVYFEGENTPEKPWKVSENVRENLREFYEQNENKALIFSRLIKELNEISEYHKGLSIILFTLKILYYPLSLVLAEILRERKSKNIRKAVIAKAKSLQSNMGIKFHVNQFYTVGCLQIFNYSKETLDFYIKNYFPMYFKLQRLLIGGYSIDNTDPLLKALYSEFEDRSDKKLEHFLIDLNQLLRNEDVAVYKHLWKITEIWPTLQCYLWQPPLMYEENPIVPSQQAQLSGIMGMDNRFTLNKNLDLFLVFSIQGKSENSIINPINQSNYDEMKNAQSKFSKHFYYTVDLPNIYFDQISCIRHKYNLREAMIEFEEKKNVFWEIQNTFSEKYLSWILGSISILSFLLNLFSFFLIVFLLVEYRESNYIYSLLTYFILFPLCQFFMIFIEFNLIVSKGSKIMSYSIYFTLFTIIKNVIITIILLVMAITLGFSDAVHFVLFLIWLTLLIFDVTSLILQCMLNARLTKTK